MANEDGERSATAGEAICHLLQGGGRRRVVCALRNIKALMYQPS